MNKVEKKNPFPEYTREELELAFSLPFTPQVLAEIRVKKQNSGVVKKMSRFWKCPDCGKKYDLDKERADLAKVSSWKLSELGPNRCRSVSVKGKHYHFNGIAGRF